MVYSRTSNIRFKHRIVSVDSERSTKGRACQKQDPDKVVWTRGGRFGSESLLIRHLDGVTGLVCQLPVGSTSTREGTVGLWRASRILRHPVLCSRSRRCACWLAMRYARRDWVCLEKGDPQTGDSRR